MSGSKRPSRSRRLLCPVGGSPNSYVVSKTESASTRTPKLYYPREVKMADRIASGKMLHSDRRTSLLEERHDECLDRLDNHLKSKCELLEVVRPRYLKASKLEKQKILDELTLATGYHRKHAIRVLKNKVQSQNHLKGKTKTYKSLYCGEVVQVLEQIWRSIGGFAPNDCNRFCPKRLRCWNAVKKSNFPKAPKNCS